MRNCLLWQALWLGHVGPLNERLTLVFLSAEEPKDHPLGFED